MPSRPTLAEVARHLHLSEYHFQRLFTRWAGVSPKRFMQFLTVEYARARLEHSRNVLDLAHDVGLASPGRLHDLCVTLEAATPGEIRSGGAGLHIHHGVHDSPFGPCLIAKTARGICSLHFVDQTRTALDELRREWPNAAMEHAPEDTATLAQRLFKPFATDHGKPLALLVKGTNFQLQVWRALLRIPFGSVASYGDIAIHLDRPSAARAVGNAVGTNPIAWLIPCHRVIRDSGTFGHYRWGENRKAALLAWEAVGIATAKR